MSERKRKSAHTTSWRATWLLLLWPTAGGRHNSQGAIRAGPDRQAGGKGDAAALSGSSHKTERPVRVLGNGDAGRQLLTGEGDGTVGVFLDKAGRLLKAATFTTGGGRDLVR
jgi:hypothetical protein